MGSPPLRRFFVWMTPLSCLENIVRPNMENGEPAMEAALKGSKESASPSSP